MGSLIHSWFRDSTLAESQGEVKRAPRAHLALHPDASAHELDKAFHDRQSQPRAAVFPRRGMVRLRERLEDHVALLLGNTDAGVGDGKLERARIARLRIAPHPHHDLTLGRELHRVTYQVDQHLPQPVWISG